MSLPQYIVNTKGSKRKFNLNTLTLSVHKETSLPIEICEKIVDAVVKRFLPLDLKTVRTSMLRESVCMELYKHDYKKESRQYAQLIDSGIIPFKLDEEFVAKYNGKQPHWGPIGYIIYKRTYSRYIPHLGRTEEFFETIQRVVEGVFNIQKQHCKKFTLPWDDDKEQINAQTMFQKIWDFKFLPPGRGLWMMGTEFIKKHGSMALNNCGFCSTEDIDTKGTKAFEWLMDALMLGVGVGFDTKGADKITIKRPKKVGTFTIPDTREGWVEALRLNLEGYFSGTSIPTFDYSLIRKKGEKIHGFGGVASGPDPLREMLEHQQHILNQRIGVTLRSIDILDIMNLIGKCVVAGNVRRSAEIALGDITDTQYITSKQDKVAMESHRWASNNSIYAYRGMDYTPILDGIAKNGEPGLFFIENARAYSRMDNVPDHKDKHIVGVNPCGEQSLESFELCCLVETFPSRHESYEEFEETLYYAYLYAKTVTLVNTHWNETNAVMGKNRRIGTSQTGIIDAFAKHGRSTILEWSDKGYSYLRQLDEEYSNRFCVPNSIKITTVKPSGTVSLLAGVSPGIHYPHAEYYIRRVQVAKNSDLIPLLRQSGYHIEDHATMEDTYIVEFPIHEEHFIRSKNDVSIWEQVANAIDYQRYWSDNQVSITVTFKPNEINDIPFVLQFVEDKLKGLSLLPLLESGYSQMPLETITKEQYEQLSANIIPITLWQTTEKGEGVSMCDGVCKR